MIAQTNLQLYNQLLQQNWPVDDLVAVRKAYLFACELYSGRYQADGKPFICHSVGVASILGHAGLPLDIVVLGLLHNVYGNGDFGDGYLFTVSPRRRDRVRAAAGQSVAALLEQFGQSRLIPDRASELCVRIATYDETQRNLIAVDLADIIEKLVDRGAAYFGDGAWVTDPLAQHGDALIDLANALGRPVLAGMLQQGLADLCMGRPIPAELQQDGQKYLELVVPLSCRRRSTLVLREHLRGYWHKAASLMARGSRA